MKFLKTISSIFRNSSKFPPFLRNVSTINISQFYITSLYIPSRNISYKNISLKNISSKNMSSKNMSSKNMSSKNMSPENMSPKNISSKNMSSKNMSSKNMSSKNISSKNMSPKNISSKNMSPKTSKNNSTKTSPSTNTPSRNISSTSAPLLFNKTPTLRISTQDNSDSESDTEESTKIDEDFVDIIEEQHISVKDILYPQSQDPLIVHLKNCASISEVFDVLSNRSVILNHEHVAQSILVLWDLQKMYYHINVVNNAVNVELNKLNELGEDFMGHLNESEVFKNLLSLVEIKIDKFDQEALACMLLYLNKIGLPLKHELLQLLIGRLREKFKKEGFSLSALSRFMVVVFSENNLAAYFCVQDLLPELYERIGTCETNDDFKMLTICLSSVHAIVTEEVVLNYKEKLRELINSGVITHGDHRTILKAIVFLNTAKFREDNMDVISECIHLLKDHMHLLNLNDLLTFYDIIYKNQEPAFILNEFLRYTSKHFLQLEDDANPLTEVKLKFLQCLVSFSSTLNRSQYNKIIKTYLKSPLSGPSLLDLHKVLLYTKASDDKMNKTYWDKMLTVLIRDKEFREMSLLKVGVAYINFYHDINQYRNFYFEKKMNQWLKEEFEGGLASVFPASLATLSSFLIIFGRDEVLLEKVVRKIEENREQFNHGSVFNLAKSINASLDLIHLKDLYSRVKDVICWYLQKKEVEFSKEIELSKEVELSEVELSEVELSEVELSKEVQFSKEAESSKETGYKHLLPSTINLTVLNMDIKSSIYLDEEKIAEKLCQKYIGVQKLTSKAVKNMVYCLNNTGVLLPEVVDNLAQYLVDFKDNILGYNMEKILSLSFSLGYTPKNDEFFKAVIDVILRDQERLSGLSYLQACLALCYYHKLPESFIKQIFNVMFLERLDVELSNCYFKDRYPVRVRHRMMQLNRAVCLDYPGCNVPWFHQKYVEETRSKFKKEQEDHDFQQSFKMYLRKLLGSDKYISTNVITPYGYFIDYVVELNGKQEVLEVNSEKPASKLAILLMRPGSYTKVQEQLKGPHQLKMRHLQILGYKTVPVCHIRWMNLTSGEEKFKYLQEIVRPKTVDFEVREVNR